MTLLTIVGLRARASMLEPPLRSWLQAAHIGARVGRSRVFGAATRIDKQIVMHPDPTHAILSTVP